MSFYGFTHWVLYKDLWTLTGTDKPLVYDAELGD